MTTAIHTWVRRLTPPVSREEVLGDLAERNPTPRAYLRDALRTLPFVIGNRIRRTTHPVGVLLVGTFLYWAIFYGNRQAHWATALIPTVLMLLVYALRDAWRNPANITHLPRTVAIDSAVAATAVLLSQGLLWLAAPRLLLNPPALLVGFPLGLILLHFARLQMPTGFHQPSGFARQLSLAELRTEIVAVETVIRRAVRIEIWACAIVAMVFLAYALWLPHDTQAAVVGQYVTVVGAGFVGVFLWRYARVRPLPAGLDFNATIQLYRADMERRVRLSRSYPWWYVVPVMIGPAIWIIGRTIRQPAGALHATLTLAVFIAIGFGLTLAQLVGTGKMQKRIEQLRMVSEKS